MSGRSWAGRSGLVAAFVLLAGSSLFWRFRITGGTASQNSFNDLSFEHYPMAAYGFAWLRGGQLPLWNPYELCGYPFFGVPYVGLLYPGNLPYLLFDAAAAIEAVYVLHVSFAGLFMWYLVRTLGLGSAGAWVAAATLMGSGAMVFSAQIPSWNATLCWLPITILLIEKALRGSRPAFFGLAVAVALQLLAGSMEFFVYNMYAGGLFAIFGLASLIRTQGFSSAIGQGSRLLAAVSVGVLLSAVQLVPSFELIQNSTRWGGAAAASYPIRAGTSNMPPAEFFSQAIRSVGMASTGLLALLFAFGFGARKAGRVWWFALTTGILAASLAFGGAVFELYAQTPVGALFRRPQKFLYLYAFAQALMAGFVVARLQDWRNDGIPPGVLSKKLSWWAGLGTLVIAAVWLAFQQEFSAYLLGALALLLLYMLFPSRAARGVLLTALVLLQLGSLFPADTIRMPRPFDRRDFYGADSVFVGNLMELAGRQRVFLTTKFHAIESVTSKQGLLSGMRTVGGYLPLVSRRHEAYFRRAEGPPFSPYIFSGMLDLNEASSPLMDLAGVRYYVVAKGEPIEKKLRSAARQPRRTGIRRRGVPETPEYAAVYERSSAHPRAFFVARGRQVESPEAALAAISEPGFVENAVVVIEPEGQPVPDGVSPVGRLIPASIRVDEPERVEVEVDAPSNGFLVLSDSYSNGWEASAAGAKLPIYRANYLFRAVPVAAGRSTVRFDYHSPSLRVGLAISITTALAVVALGGWALVRGGRETTP